jgi:hypothetical protein
MGREVEGAWETRRDRPRSRWTRGIVGLALHRWTGGSRRRRNRGYRFVDRERHAMVMLIVVVVIVIVVVVLLSAWLGGWV